jgi:hypothetical protein
MILGPAPEENMPRALLMSLGNAGIFLTSPIGIAMLLLAVAFIVVFARSKKGPQDVRWNHCDRTGGKRHGVVVGKSIWITLAALGAATCAFVAYWF